MLSPLLAAAENAGPPTMPGGSAGALAIAVSAVVMGAVVGLAIALQRRAKSARVSVEGGGLPWFMEGFALAGTYLSGAFMLAICGLVAFDGYDGLLLAAGLLAGWMVSLMIVAEPLQQRAAAHRSAGTGWPWTLDLASPTGSRGAQIAAGVSTLIVCLLLMAAELMAAGTVGQSIVASWLPPGTLAEAGYAGGVALMGALMIALILGGMRGPRGGTMMATSWLQSIKGVLVLIFCAALVGGLLLRGFDVPPAGGFPRIVSNVQFRQEIAPNGKLIAPTGPWRTLPYYRMRMEDGSISCWQVRGQSANPPQLLWPSVFTECEVVTREPDGTLLVNGRKENGGAALRPLNALRSLPIESQANTRLSPLAYLKTFLTAGIATPGSQEVVETVDGGRRVTTIYFPRMEAGTDLFMPGEHPGLFEGARSPGLWGRLDFLSLMLVLLCGTAALPHIVGRQAEARGRAEVLRATGLAVAIVAVVFVGIFYMGIGAAARPCLDPSDAWSAAPRLARAMGAWAFALFSAVALVSVLGTACGLSISAARAVAHGLLGRISGAARDEEAMRTAVIGVTVAAVILGFACREIDWTVLLEWGLTLAAAQLPALALMLWKRVTGKGIAASITVGLMSTVAWALLSPEAFRVLYGYSAVEAARASPLPFAHAGLVAIPLAFLTLVVASLATGARPEGQAETTQEMR